MSFIVECPFCGRKITADDLLEGEVSNCPGCENEVYFSREDSVEELDPMVEKIRRQSAAADKARMDNLRDVMRIQEQQRQTHNFVKWIVYIFIVFPLIFWGLWYLVAFVIGCFTGKL